MKLTNARFMNESVKLEAIGAKNASPFRGGEKVDGYEKSLMRSIVDYYNSPVGCGVYTSAQEEFICSSLNDNLNALMGVQKDFECFKKYFTLGFVKPTVLTRFVQGIEVFKFFVRHVFEENGQVPVEDCEKAYYYLNDIECYAVNHAKGKNNACVDKFKCFDGKLYDFTDEHHCVFNHGIGYTLFDNIEFMVKIYFNALYDVLYKCVRELNQNKEEFINKLMAMKKAEQEIEYKATVKCYFDDEPYEVELTAHSKKRIEQFVGEEVARQVKSNCAGPVYDTRTLGQNREIKEVCYDCALGTIIVQYRTVLK